MPVLENCTVEIMQHIPGNDWELPKSEFYDVLYQNDEIRIVRMFGAGGDKVRMDIRSPA